MEDRLQEVPKARSLAAVRESERDLFVCSTWLLSDRFLTKRPSTLTPLTDCKLTNQVIMRESERGRTGCKECQRLEA